MSRRSRRRTRSLVVRSGGPYVDGPRRSLPRAQERVLQDFSPALVPAVRARLLASRLALLYPPAKQILGRAGARPAKLTTYAALRSLRMSAPSRVRFCVSRKSRREVLFALRRAGYAGSAPKFRYRRNADSQYSC